MTNEMQEELGLLGLPSLDHHTPCSLKISLKTYSGEKKRERERAYSGWNQLPCKKSNCPEAPLLEIYMWILLSTVPAEPQLLVSPCKVPSMNVKPPWTLQTSPSASQEPQSMPWWAENHPADLYLNLSAIKLWDTIKCLFWATKFWDNLLCSKR